MGIEPINIKISNYYIQNDKEAIYGVEKHFEERGLSKNYVLLFAFDAQAKHLADGKMIDDNIYSLIDEDHLDAKFIGRIIANNPEIKQNLASHSHAFKIIAAYQVWHELHTESIGKKTIGAIKEKIQADYGLDISTDIIDRELSTRIMLTEKRI